MPPTRLVSQPTKRPWRHLKIEHIRGDVEGEEVEATETNGVQETGHKPRQDADDPPDTSNTRGQQSAETKGYYGELSGDTHSMERVKQAMVKAAGPLASGDAPGKKSKKNKRPGKSRKDASGLPELKDDDEELLSEAMARSEHERAKAMDELRAVQDGLQRHCSECGSIFEAIDVPDDGAICSQCHSHSNQTAACATCVNPRRGLCKPCLYLVGRHPRCPLVCGKCGNGMCSKKEEDASASCTSLPTSGT